MERAKRNFSLTGVRVSKCDRRKLLNLVYDRKRYQDFIKILIDRLSDFSICTAQSQAFISLLRGTFYSERQIGVRIDKTCFRPIAFPFLPN